MTEKYENAVNISIGDLIPIENFRTIDRKSRDIPGGISEIPVTININKEFANKLSFKTATSGKIYGFTRMNEKLRSLDGLPQNKARGKLIKDIIINDWDKIFILIFEMASGDEIAYYIGTDEIQNLLENCLRAPQQKLK